MSNPLDLCSISDVRQWISPPPQPTGIKASMPVLPGSGYTHITLTVVPVDGNGSGMALTGTLSGGALVGVVIVSPGSGLTASPSVIITGDGVGASAVAYAGDDFTTGRLITAASTRILSMLRRPQGIFPQTVAERRNGNGQRVMCLKWGPLITVQSVQVNNSLIPASPDGVQSGWVNDEYSIMLVPGWNQPSSRFCGGFIFHLGMQNVIITYQYGYASVPSDLAQLCIDLVTRKYKARTRIGEMSQTMGASGQTISFSQAEFTKDMLSVIDDYKIKAFIE